MTIPATSYITKDGDMVDEICWRHYGFSADVTEQVLDANRHLAFLPARLPSGIEITLPAIDEPEPTAGRVQLWD